MLTRSLAVATAILVSLSPVAQANSLDAQYTLSVAGINGGTIAIRGRDQGTRYSVSAAARASGLVGSLVKYSFDGQSQGSISGGRHISSSYSEAENDDGEITKSVTRYRGGRPSGVTFTPARTPRPYDIDPTAQSGVVDPLTALYLVMRPKASGDACGLRYDLFDGRHVSRITLGAASAASDGTITCSGEYRRIRGYSAEDMAKRPSVPLTFVFTPSGNGQVQLSEMSSPTRLGKAVLRRR